MANELDYDWFDPGANYSGEDWDMAWRFGSSAGRSLMGDWEEITPTLEEMWADMMSPKSWLQARPAVYSAWRAVRGLAAAT